MSNSGKAVFLSYASQDADAARKISDALRSAGVEVWFDQSELVGGDASDQKIRRQIKECALFIPVISANTDARSEGYFRREWKLAIDRTHDMEEGKAFLVLEERREILERDGNLWNKLSERCRAGAGRRASAFVRKSERLERPADKRQPYRGRISSR